MGYSVLTHVLQQSAISNQQSAISNQQSAISNHLWNFSLEQLFGATRARNI
jgi:hypothetical protein